MNNSIHNIIYEREASSAVRPYYAIAALSRGRRVAWRRAQVNFQCLYAYTFVAKFALRAMFPLLLLAVLWLVACHNASKTKEDAALRATFDEADLDGSGAQRAGPPHGHAGDRGG